MRVARVDKETNTVVNIEISDQQWVNENLEDTQFWFFSCDDETVFIGSVYDQDTGSFINQIVPPVFDDTGQRLV